MLEQIRALNPTLLTLLSREKLSLRPTGEVLDGSLNDNFLLINPLGDLFIWRRPKENPAVLYHLDQELDKTGFTPLGGRYRLRSILEQAEFMNRLQDLGLTSPKPLVVREEGLLIPYTDGFPFDQYLLQGNLEATSRVLDNLHLAHQRGVVYGDRWVKNTIIKPSGDPVEIDFDIELSGQKAAEFEIAQTLYHLMHFSTRREDLLKFLERYFRLSGVLQDYDLATVHFFLLNHAVHFQDSEYEGIPGGVKEEISQLTQIIHPD